MCHQFFKLDETMFERRGISHENTIQLRKYLERHSVAHAWFGSFEIGDRDIDDAILFSMVTVLFLPC